MEVTTRSEAAKRGLLKYYTGKPCKRNHLDLRYTNTGACRACMCSYAKFKREEFKKVKYPIRMEVYSVKDLNAAIAYINALNFQHAIDIL